MQNIIISSDFFENNKIKVIDSMKNGKLYIYVLLRMICIAVKSDANGALKVFDDVYFADELLSKFFSLPVSSVTESLDILQKYGLIKQEDDKYYIVDFNKYMPIKNEVNRRKSKSKLDNNI